MNRSFISNTRYAFMAIMVIAFFGVITGRLAYLHIWEHDKLGRIVERNRQRFELIHAKRGDIMDAKGNLLATTQGVIELGLDPHIQLEKDKIKWKELASLLKISVSEVEKAFAQKTRLIQTEDGEIEQAVRWIKLVEAIDEPLYEKIKALDIKGVYGNHKFQRVYPSGSLGAHVLGFVNKEEAPAMGVEQYMDFYLRGQNGWIQSEKDGKRRELAHLRTRQVKPQNGYSLELTLDMNIQHMIETELKKIVEEYDPKSVTIIISEPSTGFILGLANYPTFDPNEFWKHDISTHRNRAISDIYEPGSTFKVVPIAGALDQFLVKPDDIFDCSVATIEYQGRTVRLPKDDHPCDLLSVRDITVKSSNRGVAQLGMLLGCDRLYNYARAFGYGESTGYGPSGEVKGILHSVKKWDGLTISRLPMGHAVGATPMQVHYAMSVFANQGVLMQPQLVKKVFDEMGETIADFSPKAKRRVVSVRAAQTVRTFLSEATVGGGTGRKADLQEFTIAGKTGTTQKIINGKYSHTHHVASFSGFFPAERPQVVVTVVIDEPQLKGCGYGGAVAAPVFKKIAEQLVQYLGIQPEKDYKTMLAWRANGSVNMN